MVEIRNIAGMRNSSISVITCDSSSLEVAATLFDEYRKFYGKTSDIEAAKKFLKICLDQSKSSIFLALNLADRSGIGFMQLYPTFSSLSLKPSWILNDLYVQPDFRRLGVARSLIDRAQLLAVETGAAGLFLQTAMTNEPAQRLYERMNWKRDNEFYTYVWSPSAT